MNCSICESVKFYFRVVLKLLPFLLLVDVPTVILFELYPDFWQVWSLMRLITLPAIYFATYDCAEGEMSGLSHYVKKSLANFLWIPGINILVGLILLGLALLMVVPALIGFVYLQFAADCFSDWASGIAGKW